jgi:uncharacterized membrane protein
MTESTAPQVVRSYLTQLQKALADLPREVSEEIVAGIREELDGLDASAAANRIETLGDPEFIAAEARTATGLPSAATPVVEPGETTAAEPRWLPVLAALLVAFGGVVIPVIGWLVGIAMVWMSKSWRRLDKWVATLTPFVASALFVAIFASISAASQNGAGGANPLIPGLHAAIWSAVVLVIPVNAIVGVWLLWRVRKGWQREQTSTPAVPLNSKQPTWYSVLTVALIIVGGYVVPVVGWLVGVAMLWASDRWSRRDKWLGTLAGPLAAVIPVAMLLVARLWLPATGGGFDPFLLIILGGVALPLIANLIVGIRLLRR